VNHVKGENDRIAMIRRISLNRLIEGGAAILAALNRNHQRAIYGEIIASPFVMYNLRVLVDSYVIFAIAKSAEEERPWAIIIKVAPKNPNLEKDSAPAIRSPICPTEE
jgi:hypothetical protein